jgi:NAD+ diphosphatase
MNDRAYLAGAQPMVFAGSNLDRAETLRRDEAAMARLIDRPGAMGVIFFMGQPHLDPAGGLSRIAAAHAPPVPHGREPFFLGLEEGRPLFAFDTDEPMIDLPGQFSDARMAAMGLSPYDAAILGQARSLIEWRRKHGFCSNCGAPTRQISGGAKRICDSCGAEHFPRVDPVAIMLATNGDYCLLGRQTAWPERIWSALAGFIEPGETMEEGCARELKEEAGVTADISAIRYVMGQPWPFPSQLMLGLVAPVLEAEITVDTLELEQARWFSRAEVRAMIAGEHSEVDLPPPLAIARRLCDLWAAEKI